VADGVDLWTGAPHLLSLRDTCNLLLVLAPLRPPPPLSLVLSGAAAAYTVPFCRIAR
jgi:hypothetical protein